MFAVLTSTYKYLSISTSTLGNLRKYLSKVQVLSNLYLSVLKYKYSCTWPHVCFVLLIVSHVTSATFTNNMADRGYNLRKRVVSDYRQLTSLKLPRNSRKQVAQKLYPIKVVARRESQVRIHYIGYDDDYDEWREADDLVPLNQDDNRTNTNHTTIIQPLDLHFELGVKIKQALVCGKKQSPRVIIDIGFDYLLFQGGLQVAGVATERVRGIQRCTLKRYHDLDHLLGENWHYRGINSRGDYASSYLIQLSTIYQNEEPSQSILHRHNHPMRSHHIKYTQDIV